MKQAQPRSSLFFLLTLFLVLASPVRAQEYFSAGPFQAIRVSPRYLAPEDVCVLHPGEEPAHTPPLSLLRLEPRAFAPTATIAIDYNGFDGAEGQQAREAFQRAADIWAQHIRSPVTIKIRAIFSDELDENVLGSAGAFSLWFGTTEDNVRSIYPDALIDALVGDNVVRSDDDPGNDDDPDIIANFSSDANWYYGTGTPPEGTFDFTTVVLHELAHGLGFFGSMTVTNIDQDDAEEGLWPFSEADMDLGVPTIYDRFAEEGRTPGTALIDTTVYPNPSDHLAAALTGRNLFFDGFQVLTANEGRAPRLWAPDSWSQGSSYSHVHEDIFQMGGANALMTPFINPREVVRSPGGVVCGMFADIGWPLGPACKMLVNADLRSFTAMLRGDGAVQLDWTLKAASDVDRIVVEQQYFDGSFQPVDSLDRNQDCTPDGEDTRCTVALKNVGLGQYAFRLMLQSTQDPAGDYATLAREVRIGLQSLQAEAAPESTPSGNYEITLQWEVPVATEGFSYDVQMCAGLPEEGCSKEEGAFRTVRRVDGATEARQQYEAIHTVTGPGYYTYRLRMTDAQDHVLISDLSRPNIEGTVAIDLTEAYALSPAYPNPFARSAQLDLTVRETQEVTVEVYNVLGQRVRMFEEALTARAREALVLDARGLASGVYLVRITGRAFSATRKVVVAR